MPNRVIYRLKPPHTGHVLLYLFIAGLGIYLVDGAKSTPLTAKPYIISVMGVMFCLIPVGFALWRKHTAFIVDEVGLEWKTMTTCHQVDWFQVRQCEWSEIGGEWTFSIDTTAGKCIVPTNLENIHEFASYVRRHTCVVDEPNWHS